MSNLMLHCGADAVTLETLATMPVPEPIGPRHAIRPFHADVELAQEYLDKEGFIVEDQAFGVKKGADGQPKSFFGVMQTRLPGIEGSDDYGLMIGMRGSYDQSLPRALAVGSRVFVCDNLAFSGEVSLHTKQTLNIDKRMPGILQSAVAQLPGLVQSQEFRFDAYRNEQIDRQLGDHWLMQLVRTGALMPSQIGRALHEWESPSYDEHAEQDMSVWRFHNAVTEAIKPANPDRAAVPVTWQRTRTLTDFLDRQLGLTAGTGQPELHLEVA